MLKKKRIETFYAHEGEESVEVSTWPRDSTELRKYFI